MEQVKQSSRSAAAPLQVGQRLATVTREVAFDKMVEFERSSGTAAAILTATLKSRSATD